MARWIGHLTVAGFYCEAHRRHDSSLLRRPIAVVRAGRVIDVSPEAAREGARLGITPRELRWLCPQATVCLYSEELYRHLYEELWEVVYHFTPVVEPVASHAGFFDATGCLHDMTPTQWRQALASTVAHTLGLQPQVGLGPTRALAQMAARAGACLEASQAEEFIAQVPIEELPVDAAAREFLDRLGLRTVGEVRQVPLATLAARLGQSQARLLKQIAEARDSSRVVPLYPPPRLTRRLTELVGLEALQIRQLLAAACRELHAVADRRSLAPTTLRLTLEPLDRAPHRGEHRFSVPPASARAIEHAAWKVWLTLWHGEELAAAEVMLAGLQVVGPRQFDLFGSVHQTMERKRRLEQALEYVRSRFGDKALVQASELPGRVRFAEQILTLQRGGYA